MALLKAAETGDLAAIDVLLQNGADVDGEDEYVPLCRAAENGQAAACDVLLRRGADVDKGEDGETALFLACEAGDVDVIDVLLSYGADFNVVCKHGRTAMRMAAESCNHSAVVLLAKAGAKIDYLYFRDDVIRYIAMLHNDMDSLKRDNDELKRRIDAMRSSKLSNS